MAFGCIVSPVRAALPSPFAYATNGRPRPGGQMRRWAISLLAILVLTGVALSAAGSVSAQSPTAASPTDGEVASTDSDAPLLVLGIGLLLAIAAGSGYFFFRKPSRDDAEADVPGVGENP